VRLPILQTERTTLRVPERKDVPKICKYYLQNRQFLAPYEPVRSEKFYTKKYWNDRVKQSRDEFYADIACRFFIYAKTDNEPIIGAINFTMIERGPSDSCRLGYGLSREYEGKGYMSEALQAGIHFVFETLNIHRIDACYMPKNVRSGRLLERLGFEVIGLARDYLFIDGQWEDHLLTCLLNPKWHGAT